MRIGIDANLILGVRRGGAQYVYNLIKSLVELDKENNYVLFYNFLRSSEKYKKIMSEFSRPNVENKIISIPSKVLNLLWNRFSFPSLDSMLRRIDLFHSPFCVQTLPFKKCKWIVTIHQVTPEKYRAFEHDWRGKEKFYQMLKEVPQKAAFVITDATYTKDALVGEFHFPEENIRVIPLAANNSFYPVKDKVLLKERLTSLGIRERYILYAGGAHWNKNLGRLIDAFSHIKHQPAIRHKLVLAGEYGWGFSKILPRIQQALLNDEIIFTGYISDEDLVYLYNGADFFIYPSLLEGFGFSAVEAMACGCPLAASDIPVFKEVIKEAGLFFNPEDVEDISRAMVKLIEDENLRQNLREEGLEQAKLFSWEKTARETLSVYKEAVER